MKVIFYFFILLVSLSACKKEEVTYSEDVGVILGDAVFRQFCYHSYDSNNDGIISQKEAESVKNINADGLDLKSVKGLQIFSNLEMINLSNTNISGELDLSKCTKIKKIELIGCPSIEVLIVPESKYSPDAINSLLIYDGKKDLVIGKR